MSSSLQAWAQRIAAAKPEMESVEYGPWLGTKRSVPADRVGREYMVSGTNMLYRPRSGHFQRMGGQAVKFDTAGALVGLLPAKWSSVSRELQEFTSDSITDSVPTLIALVTKETVAAGLDDGRFSQIYIRDQVGNGHVYLGDDFTSYYDSTYSSEQRFKMVPLWYESGDGGLTRGADEFSRRFLACGSRKLLKQGRWWYWSSRYGTPARWDGHYRPTSAVLANRIIPSGPLPMTHAGKITAGTADAAGTWYGRDRFAYAIVPVFEDGSVLAPTEVRLPNDQQPSGFGIATVDATNPDVRYRFVTLSQIPVPMNGVKELIVCRGPKVDSLGANSWNINPFDLRPVLTVAAGVTSVQLPLGDDATLVAPEVAKLFVRHDYMMPPRARYVFGGPQRVCHAYGGESPCAIVIAPLSRVTSGDLNVDDSHDPTEATSGASYMRIYFDEAGAAWTLDLVKTSLVPAITYTETFNLATYDTLRKLVDAINATTFLADASNHEWRAQLLPNAPADVSPIDALVPHARQIGSCVVAGQSITKAAGGLSKVAVGAKISGTGVTLGAYVSAIVSDTQLTFVGTITAATKSLTYYFELGDAPTAATANMGYQRVISNAWPGFLYFSATQLNKTRLDTQAVWMTTADPGTPQAAANCFSRKSVNVHHPVTPGAGIFMGGGAVDNGFVVFYANRRGAIRNTRDVGTGRDEDYHLFMLNENHGICSWNTVVTGNRFVLGLSPEGMIAADLYDERLLSEDIFLHAPQTGDFGGQVENDRAATAADNDSAKACARILRGAIWLGFKVSGFTQSPTRYVVYDFSSGTAQNGLAALFRPDGKPWGWSLLLTINAGSVSTRSAMCEGRRSDGVHLYGWDDANGGATGDGGIHEFETGDTQDGLAIAAEISAPWLTDSRRFSVQELELEHDSPAASTGSLVFVRSLDTVQYALTPSTSALQYTRDLKLLPQDARAPAYAVLWKYSQATGSARTLRRVVMRRFRLMSYT